MKEIAKGVVSLIELVIAGGVPHFACDSIREITQTMLNELLDKINERKVVSDSPTKLFNLLINSLLLIKNDENLALENYVDTVGKLTYNRYLIKKFNKV